MRKRYYRAKKRNGRIGSWLLTNILLLKNFTKRNHFFDAKEKSPYTYMRALLREYPRLTDKPAIICGRTVTYGTMLKEIDSVAKFLYEKLQCGAGENVAICAAGSTEGIEAFFALNAIGSVAARIFNGASEEKIRTNLLDFAARTVFTDAANLTQLAEAISGTTVEHVILMDICSEVVCDTFKTKNPQVVLWEWEQLQQVGAGIPELPQRECSLTDNAAILYTSGSSGEPKPILISNAAYVYMPQIVKTTTNQRVCDGEKVVGVVSHEYPYAAINSTAMILMLGKTLILPAGREGLNFKSLLESEPDKIQAIPNFYKLLENQSELPERLLGNLKNIVSGGEVFLEKEKLDILQYFEGKGICPLLIDGFGFGELGSAVALKFGMSSDFLLMNGVRAKAVDEKTKTELPAGKEGLLAITSPCIAEGYWHNKEATAQAFVYDENGEKWFISDTYGSVHGLAKRRIRLGGRVREYFICGDGNGNFVKVYAGNVENVIVSTGLLTDCIVVPSDSGALPHPVAYAVLKQGLSLTADKATEEIHAACRSLESFARPVEIYFVPAVKRTDAGKKDYGYYRRLRANVP